MIPVNYVFAFFGLLFASIFDIKTREIPDWLNYSMIGLGFGTAVIYSTIFLTFRFLVSAVLGFLLALLIAMIFYKAGQWGGGDAKAMMGLGALIGLEFTGELPIFIILLLNIFIIGAIYGTVWSVFLAIKHKKQFKKSFKEIIREKNILIIRKTILIIVVLLLLSLLITPTLVKPFILGIAAFVFFVFYFYVYSKAVEKAAMEKYIPIEKLTEGDWVLEEIYANKKKICSPKDYGVTKKQIAKLLELKKYHKRSKIKIKEGIPFLPSFFIAFVMLLLLGNWLMWLL
ncbi:MAG: prepilin peptidase [Nanoarchaeota archaeon]|nr:prepilin peptidase [DPANN group archaeon]MBL7116428.1 prepilin peptidase [Nanoarchaeota archaeon]